MMCAWLWGFGKDVDKLIEQIDYLRRRNFTSNLLELLEKNNAIG